MADLQIFDLNDDSFSEEQLLEEVNVHLYLEGIYCLHSSLPNLEILSLECDEDSKLIIDAPNVKSLWLLGEAKITNISYLPSLEESILDTMLTLHDSLTPEMKKRVDEAYQDFENCKGDNLTAREYEELLYAAEAALTSVYLQCYHELYDERE